jgi:hypothetical protein
MSIATTQECGSGAISAAIARKILWGLAGLATAALALSFAGKLFSASVSLAGYTEDLTPKTVVIGGSIISAPANTIRFERARQDGPAPRLDLYLRWPQLDGYSSQARDDFNNAGNVRNILFLTIEERMMSRDMSGRFAPIYSSLIVTPGARGPGGLTVYDFSPKSGYLNEVLVAAKRPGKTPFVARCLSGQSAEESLAPCERDVHFADNLSLTYRFPRELLAKWQTLDAVVMARAYEMLKDR